MERARRPRSERLSVAAGGYFFLGIEHRKNGRMEHFLKRSEKLYSLAAEADTSSIVPRNNRALVREALGDFEGAFLDFEAAKRLCNGNAEQKGVVERNSGNTCARISIGRRKLLLESILI
jgi:hypothetical protein